MNNTFINNYPSETFNISYTEVSIIAYAFSRYNCSQAFNNLPNIFYELCLNDYQLILFINNNLSDGAILDITDFIYENGNIEIYRVLMTILCIM